LADREKAIPRQTMSFTEDEQKLLNELQFDFPVTRNPWKDLGERVGLNETDVLELVREFRGKRDVIRRIGGIFEGRRLGYRSALVGGRVCPERIESAAAAISTHPGVSHNYERHGDFNLWYTVAVPGDTSLEATVERLGDLAALRGYRILPELVRYKIGVKLDAGRSGPGDRDEIGEPVRPMDEPPPDLSETDRACVRALQEDLPLESRPFAVLAEQTGVTEKEFLEWIERFRRETRLRRIAVILRHRNVGYVANAMGVWRVPEDRADEAGKIMASFRRVSHCYRRPVFDDWPYALYTMIHGLSREDCERVAELISEAAGVDDYRLLYSGREFKKTRVRYFVPEFGEWEGAFLHGPAPGEPGNSAPPAMRSAAAKIRSRGEAARLVGALQERGKTVVFTGGCFDVLGPVHVRFFEAARREGDVLVAAVGTDDSVRRLKGPGRPLLPERERALLVAALRTVDHVVLFSEPVEDVLREIRPDVYARDAGSGENRAAEHETARSFGGRVVIVGDSKNSFSGGTTENTGGGNCPSSEQ
jgi:rfaE bifunctional protein nucleotidyltransferase chain/domain